MQFHCSACQCDSIAPLAYAIPLRFGSRPFRFRAAHFNAFPLHHRTILVNSVASRHDSCPFRCSRRCPSLQCRCSAVPRIPLPCHCVSELTYAMPLLIKSEDCFSLAFHPMLCFAISELITAFLFHCPSAHCWSMPLQCLAFLGFPLPLPGSPMQFHSISTLCHAFAGLRIAFPQHRLAFYVSPCHCWTPPFLRLPSHCLAFPPLATPHLDSHILCLSLICFAVATHFITTACFAIS